ncbi:MAG: class I SAM-dependent methyltransferase [Bacteroidetes bacterium]|nr:class I SAM-dependent methyltransferase [Bacteroidota bacterium]
MAGSVQWRLAQFLEKRWWKAYLNNKDMESYLEWKTGYWNLFLTRVNPYMKMPTEGRIADMGCGPAGIFMALPQFQVVAADPLIPYYIKELKVLNPSRYPHVRFVPMGLEWLPANLGQFHTVFSLNAINHVSDLAAAFKTLFDLTAPGGTCVVSIDAHRFMWLKYLFAAIPADALHPHQYVRGEYRDMMERAGFVEVQEIEMKKGPIFTYCVWIGQKKPN